MRTLLYILLLWASASACAGIPGGPLSTLAQRTTETGDTATAAPGSLELELGSVSSSGSNIELPLTARFGLGPATELSIQGPAYQRVEDESGGRRATGPGDLGVNLRHRFIEERHGLPSVALDLFAKAPTASAARGLGSGEPDIAAALSASKDLGLATGFMTVRVSALGQEDERYASETLVAASLALPLSEDVSVFAEVASVRPSGESTAWNTIFGCAWAASESLLLEAGVQHGLDGNPDPDLLLLGVTWNLGMLFE